MVREPGIALLAFYYCWDCFPQEGIQGAWRFRTYADPRDDKAVTMEAPKQTSPPARCAVRFEEARSLPVWEGHDRDFRGAYELSKAVNPDSPWEAYNAACERVAGTQDIETAVGGYPHWLQGDDLPEGHRLLAAIDSEEAARHQPPVPTLLLQSL